MNEKLDKELKFATEHRGERMTTLRFVSGAVREGYRLQYDEVVIVQGKRLQADIHAHLVLIFRCKSNLLFNQ